MDITKVNKVINQIDWFIRVTKMEIKSEFSELS